MSPDLYVVSDLHLGAKSVEPNLEDFRDDDLLAKFITYVAEADATLVINGDLVDFPQIPPYSPASAKKHIWDEEASLTKLSLAMVDHAKPFEALKSFAECAGSVKLIVGNHDLDLAWPRVQQRLRDATGLRAGDKLDFHLDHYVHAGVVHVEHGHMFTKDNSTKKRGDFIVEKEGHRYLERVWGTDFMLRIYNDLEREHPRVDAIRPMLAAFFLGVRHRWWSVADIIASLAFLSTVGLPGVKKGTMGMAAVPGEFQELSLAAEWGEVLGEFAEANPQVFQEAPQVMAEVSAGAAKSHRLGMAAVPRELSEKRVKNKSEQSQTRAAQSIVKANPAITHVVLGHTHELVDHEFDGTHLLNPGTWMPYAEYPDLWSLVRKSDIDHVKLTQSCSCVKLSDKGGKFTGELVDVTKL
jgi:UDP-2,3-diacylglucosamine pyrophosphatase LpxH